MRFIDLIAILIVILALSNLAENLFPVIKKGFKKIFKRVR